MNNVIVITSGKGGVGKTTTTANIGAGLALSGKSTVLVDTDIGLRNLDVVLGLENRIVFDLVDVAEGSCRLKQALIKDKRYDGLYLLPAAQSRNKMAVTPEQMKEIVKQLEDEFDYVIIDCPAGLGRGFETAVAAAERALVVTTPDMVCARDAQVVGHLLFARDLPARLIINRLRPSLVMRGAMPDVDEIIDTAGLQLMGVLPEDEQVAVANANGRPLPDACNASSCFSNIARRYLGEDVPLARLEKM